MDSLITEERLRIYPIVFAVATVLGVAITSLSRIADPTVQGAFLPDYLAHWTGGGLLFADPSNLYDPERQFAFEQRELGAVTALSWFVSPPIVAALYAPLGMLPYNLSGILWLIVSASLLVCCTLSLKSLAPGLMLRKRTVVVIAVLASPPVFELLGGGQDSAFILAVWLAGIQLLNGQHNVWAGVVLALGIAKPQLVVLVPLVLLATRNFRALTSFVAVCGLLLGIQVGLIGVDGIFRWVSALSSPLYMEEVQQGQSWKMVGLPSLIQGLIPEYLGGWVASTLMSISLPVGAGVLLFRLHRASKQLLDTNAVWIATLATTAIFSPHLATYDAVLFIPIIVFLLERRPSRRIRVSTVAAFGLLWAVPVLHVAAAPLSWPMGLIDAPWSAIPLTVIWLESLRTLQPHDPGKATGTALVAEGIPASGPGQHSVSGNH
ncbi:glycosyltransferase family 87 protein [Pseudarthrobacter sulfonivorans]|uniref:glycosyltransferase family 87 protein n=1 Tax=Pseudarthrobacter sulfonivorans TaxID=121292 RepID=UPI002106A12D|nr:glycosyltransferase family 87 protein [Pseudarthrobacter sulfonivorans]